MRSIVQVFDLVNSARLQHRLWICFATVHMRMLAQLVNRHQRSQAETESADQQALD